MKPDLIMEGAKSSALRLAFTPGLPGICGLLALDGQNRVLALSAELAKSTGLKPGISLPDGSRGGSPLPLLEMVTAVRTKGPGMVERQFEWQSPRHGPSIMSVCGFTLNPGKPDGITVLMIKDDPAAQFLKGAFAHIDRLSNLGTLSASMAHEVKNALVAVKTFIDLLLEKDPNAELAKLVRRELDRIQSLVTNTLRFAGPGGSQRSTVVVHDTLEHALSLAGPQLRAKDIKVTRDFKSNRAALSGEHAQLTQAFVNLFLNAAEATPHGGSLYVGSEDWSDGGKPGIRLTVRDSGTGMTPESLRKAFEPFFTTKPQGTGLGLAITRHIIQEHSGTITVESRPGEGTTFRIELPVEP